MKPPKPKEWTEVIITAGMLKELLGKVVCSPTIYEQLETMAREKLSGKSQG